MPAEAIKDPYGVDDLIQTKTIPFNLEKIREFGEAMIFGARQRFGEHDELNTRSVDMYGCGKVSDLAYWVSQDFNTNSKLLEILTTEVATDDTEKSDYVFNSGRISSYSQKVFNDDITNMLTSIRECAPLISSESTILLAKRIEAMNNDDDIGSWASRLASDISQGKD